MSVATEKIKTVFLAALEKTVPAERATFLNEACAGDADLRRRVEALLQAHDQPDPLLDHAAAEHLSAELTEADGADERFDFLAPPTKPGSLGRLGQYEVLEVVGRGGMSVVFRAFDDKLQRVVAIKALAPLLASSSAARRRFVREARAAAAVTHDNVIAIHAVEDAGPVPYLVMQFIDGMTLQEKIEAAGPLPLKETLRIGLHVAEGLAAAHRQGLVHRDVKPSNILLENGVERVKLTDFGLARAGDDASLTQSGVIAGTPMYMSPEQAQGKAVDFRSDLFSLGSVLYAMCTGRPPFRAPTALAVLKRVCEETPRSVREINPDVPSWLTDVLTRLSAKDPADRFDSAREVADLLARHLAELQHGGTASLPPMVVPTKLPSRSRRPWAAAAAALFLLFTGLGLGETIGVTNVRGTVIRLISGQGTLVIETDDPGLSVSLGGEELVIAGAGVREIRLKPGDYEVRATKEGKLIRQELVTVTRDGRQVVRVSREPTPERAAALDAAMWERTLRALPAEEQVKAVVARLMELNPDFDGKHTYKTTDGVVTSFQFSTDQVTNIAPVRALSKLETLDCAGSRPSQGRLRDLWPLKGMSLTRLSCFDTAVSDLSPLKGMPLTWLDCTRTQVKDLSPLQGMPLLHLIVELLPVTDLTPLRGMPLVHLGLYKTSGVTDLSPLKGMPLAYLNLTSLAVSDLSLLKEIKTLKNLVLDDMPIRDLSMLQGLELEALRIYRTQVSDLTPLRGQPLEKLCLDFRAERDTEVLRSFTSLKEINEKPAAEFWKEQRGAKTP